MQVIILSGRSGSGKTVALRSLEDLGFYCVDNIPLSLLPSLVNEVRDQYPEIALGVDARNVGEKLDHFRAIGTALSSQKIPYQVIFVDADDSTLLKRFSETRRRHPLTQHQGIPLKEAIAQERDILDPIANEADLLIDTTSLTPHELKEFIRDRVLGKESSGLELLFESFGFKRGLPTDADFVFDARCLPNPYWEPELREFNGTEQPIIDFLSAQPMVIEFEWQTRMFLHNWIPRFEQANRSYLTIAVGCTGGRHRSVFIIEQLARHFREQHPATKIRHRDMPVK